MSKGIDKTESEAMLIVSKMTTTHNAGGTQSCGTYICPLKGVEGVCRNIEEELDCDGTEWKCDVPRNHSAR